MEQTKSGMVDSKLFGYARVSSREQNLNRQLDALYGFGVEACNVFADKASGRDFNRTAWRRLCEQLSSKDVLVVKSIDRLGRSYDEIQEQWRYLTREIGCAVVVLDMPLLDTRAEMHGVTGKLISDIVLQLLSYVAQVERENIRQRQAEGIASAKARGVQFGRPKKQRPQAYEAVCCELAAGTLTRKQAAQRCNVSISTLSRWMREDSRNKCADETLRAHS